MQIPFRTPLKVALLSILTMLALTAVAALALHFDTTALRWLEILRQARIALLVWRLCLYASIAAFWLSLRRRAQQRAPQQLPVLYRLACAFTVMMALNELSCVLAWRTAL